VVLVILLVVVLVMLLVMRAHGPILASTPFDVDPNH